MLQTPKTIQVYADADGVLRFLGVSFHGEDGSENGAPRLTVYALGEQVASSEANRACARGEIARVVLLEPREVDGSVAALAFVGLSELDAQGFERSGEGEDTPTDA